MKTPLNPWEVQEKPQTQPVPPAIYYADFAGVADKVVKDFKTGQDVTRWLWRWKIKTGPEAGKDATALTEQTIHPASQAGVLIAGLMGRELKPGENVKEAIDACVGRPYMANVAPGPKGGKPAVRSVSKPPQM